MNNDARQRYRDYVVLWLEGRKILFEADERSLIGDGIAKFGLDGDQARGIVAVVGTEECKILERDVSRNMLNVMIGLAGKKGAVSKAKFAQGVEILRGMSKGQVSEAQARVWLKQVVEESALRVRGAGLFRRTAWFRKIKPAV